MVDKLLEMDSDVHHVDKVISTLFFLRSLCALMCVRDADRCDQMSLNTVATAHSACTTRFYPDTSFSMISNIAFLL